MEQHTCLIRVRDNAGLNEATGSREVQISIQGIVYSCTG